MPRTRKTLAEYASNTSNGAAIPAKKRGRKRAPVNQRTIDDLVLEDPDLAEALESVTQNELAAVAYREARHAVKTLIQTKHEDLINAKTDAGLPRYAVVDGHRFLYRTATRPAGKKAAAAGVTTKLEIHRIIEPASSD